MSYKREILEGNMGVLVPFYCVGITFGAQDFHKRSVALIALNRAYPAYGGRIKLGRKAITKRRAEKLDITHQYLGST